MKKKFATAAPRIKRVSTGIPAFDEVLGGGLVLGSCTLIAGHPGVGKTTLLVQALGELAKRRINSVFVSGDETAQDVQRLAQRIGCESERIVVAATSMLIGLAPLESYASNSKALVVDPITMRYEKSSAVLKAVAMLKGWACDYKIAILLSSHSTKRGEARVSMDVLHLVDTILWFDFVGEDGKRELIVDGKNRYGSESAKARLCLTERGFVEVR